MQINRSLSRRINGRGFSTIFMAAVAVSLGAKVASAATLLAVDVNDRQSTDSPDTVPGFSTYVLTGTSAAITAPVTQTVSGYSVTLAPFDDGLDENLTNTGVQNTTGAIDDRDRATPTNSGSLTYAQMYDDLIFAGASTGFTGGMDLTVGGGSLLPNTQYYVSIYAFDSGSTPGIRTANWTDGNNAEAAVLTTSFDGTVLPTTNGQYKFTGLARTDATGALLLHGRNGISIPTSGGVTPGVFINGFEIVELPEPTSLSALVIGAVTGLRRNRRAR